MARAQEASTSTLVEVSGEAQAPASLLTVPPQVMHDLVRAAKWQGIVGLSATPVQRGARKCEVACVRRGAFRIPQPLLFASVARCSHSYQRRTLCGSGWQQAGSCSKWLMTASGNHALRKGGRTVPQARRPGDPVSQALNRPSSQLHDPQQIHRPQQSDVRPGKRGSAAADWSDSA